MVKHNSFHIYGSGYWVPKASPWFLKLRIKYKALRPYQRKHKGKLELYIHTKVKAKLEQGTGLSLTCDADKTSSCLTEWGHGSHKTWNRRVGETFHMNHLVKWSEFKMRLEVEPNGKFCIDEINAFKCGKCETTLLSTLETNITVNLSSFYPHFTF